MSTASPRQFIAFAEEFHLVSLTKSILIAAFISFLLSVSLWFLGHKDEGLFVGIWVPSILSLGALLEARR